MSYVERLIDTLLLIRPKAPFNTVNMFDSFHLVLFNIHGHGGILVLRVNFTVFSTWT